MFNLKVMKMNSRSKKLDQDLSDVAEVVETSSDEDTEVVLDLNA